jgi:guanine deaminase
MAQAPRPLRSDDATRCAQVAWVKELHPADESYTSCYDSHGLLGPRTLLAHGIYLQPAERALLKARGASDAQCSAPDAQ